MVNIFLQRSSSLDMFFVSRYIFIKTSHSRKFWSLIDLKINFNLDKSTLRLTSEDGDSDGQYQIRRLDNSETDLNSSQTDKTIDSLLSDDINNTNEKINYENIQMLIENLQQSSKMILQFSSNRIL
jgi:hypothetical protein